MNRIKSAYGPHLTMDGYGCKASRLASIEVIYEYLDMMPGLIGMTKIMPPYVFKFYPLPGRPPDEQGISGFVLIAESHIAIHTYPERVGGKEPSLLLDIFSCKDFDTQLAERRTVAYFEVDRHKTNVTDRGLEFPKCIPTVAGHMVKERMKGD